MEYICVFDSGGIVKWAAWSTIANCNQYHQMVTAVHNLGDNVTAKLTLAQSNHAEKGAYTLWWTGAPNCKLWCACVHLSVAFARRERCDIILFLKSIIGAWIAHCNSPAAQVASSSQLCFDNKTTNTLKHYYYASKVYNTCNDNGDLKMPILAGAESCVDGNSNTDVKTRGLRLHKHCMLLLSQFSEDYDVAQQGAAAIDRHSDEAKHDNNYGNAAPETDEKGLSLDIIPSKQLLKMRSFDQTEKGKRIISQRNKRDKKKKKSLASPREDKKKVSNDRPTIGQNIKKKKKKTLFVVSNIKYLVSGRFFIVALFYICLFAVFLLLLLLLLLLWDFFFYYGYGTRSNITQSITGNGSHRGYASRAMHR